MRNYPSDLQRHLANYKASRLGIEQPGTFMHGGKELQYGHILPAELRWLNILEQHRAEIKRYVEARPQIKLHKFFHHLNSSQAFALNAFLPFFEGAAGAELLAALGVGGTAVDWEVEHVADPREGTNVDVTWKSEDGSRTYCEVKLSEQDFGTAEVNDKRRCKLAQIYEPVLRPYCPDGLLQEKEFFGSYQILRNVWLAAREPGACVLFLMPRANAVLWERLDLVLTRIAPEVASRVHTCAIEEALSSLVGATRLPPALALCARALQEKYVLPQDS